MTDRYDKLVLDQIPAILRATGRDCVVETLDDAQYDRALRTKLVEEAQEASAATGDALIGELADVLEVGYRLCQISDEASGSSSLSLVALRG